MRDTMKVRGAISDRRSVTTADRAVSGPPSGKPPTEVAKAGPARHGKRRKGKRQ